MQIRPASPSTKLSDDAQGTREGTTPLAKPTATRLPVNTQTHTSIVCDPICGGERPTTTQHDSGRIEASQEPITAIAVRTIPKTDGFCPPIMPLYALPFTRRLRSTSFLRVFFHPFGGGIH